MRKIIDPRKRALAKFTVGDECWKWTGGTGNTGYGRIRVGDKMILAHRFVYEWLIEEIPDSLQLDHLCHNESNCPGGIVCEHRRCVRPDHLEPVTQTENLKRGKAGINNSIKVRCPKGHPYNVENTLITVKGSRNCRTCVNAAHKLAYHAKHSGGENN